MSGYFSSKVAGFGAFSILLASIGLAGANPRVVEYDLEAAKVDASKVLLSHDDLEGSTLHDNIDGSGLEVTLADTASDETLQAAKYELGLLDDVRIDIEYGAPVVVAATDALLTGELIGNSAGFYCSAGFQIHRDGFAYRVTAGHCHEPGHNEWFDYNAGYSGNHVTFGEARIVSYPRFTDTFDDYLFIEEFDDVQTRSRINLGTKNSANDDMNWNAGSKYIDSARSPVKGDSVCRMGAVSGMKCGEVQELNVWITSNTYPLRGLTEVNVCAELGDSGGPLFTNTSSGESAAAIGILSSSDEGTCWDGNSKNDRSYFQLMDEIIDDGYTMNP